MRTLIITDTETTGLDPATHRVIEVACIVYDVVYATPVESFSALIKSPTNEAADINHIPPGVLACARDDAWVQVATIADDVARFRGPAAFVAHRAEFDRGFYVASIAAQLPWVCSKFDIEFPLSKPGASLVEVALAHGVPVHANHRAMVDCDLIAKTLTRCAELGHDLQAMIAKAMRPKALYQAMVSYDDRDKAKSAGFAWDGATKRWTRKMVKEDAAALGFRVQEIAP